MKTRYNILFTLWIVLLSVGNSFAQRPHLRFEQINFDDGLSDNSVNTILQDQKGFIWMGTKDGLNQYDGYDFKIFRNQPDNKFSISNNTIDCLFEDKDGNLWIGTFGGLNMLERKSGRFLNAGNHKPFDSDKLRGDIYDITQDKKGNIWIATAWLGVVVVNEKGIVAEYSSEGGKAKLSSNTVTSIVQDKNGDTWIGTTNGLNRLKKGNKECEIIPMEGVMNAQSVNDLSMDENGTLWIATKAGLVSMNSKTLVAEYYFFNPANPFDFFSQRNILHLEESNKGIIYMGTARNGVVAFDKSSKEIYHYQSDGISKLSDNHIHAIHIDHAQSLWLGTNGYGVNYSNSKTNMFTSYSNTGRNSNGLAEGDVTSFYQDKKKRLWVGIDGGGLHYFNESSRKFEKILFNDEGSESRSNIRGITEDHKGRLWVTTFGGKLLIYDAEDRRFEKLPKYLEPLSDELSCIFKDSKGRIWIGSETSGITVVNSESQELRNFSYDPEDEKSLSYDQVNFVFEQQNGEIWIGTNNGLNKYDADQGNFVRYLPDSTDPKSISSIAVTSMTEDKRGRVWVGTAGGLNLFDVKGGTFMKFGKKDGFASNVIYNIMEDERRNLWISTDNGITCFRFGASLVVRNYTPRDGIQGKKFNRGSGYKSDRGTLYFGGSKGFTEIVPGNIRKNDIPPPVHLTGLRLFYEPVVPGAEGSILKQPISESKEINLDYSQNVITFEFTALNFIVSSENKYRYKLVDFDSKWIESGSNRSATYTNLNPGSYTFKVQACNNDGVWNKVGTSINVIITPPYWMTWWFRILVGTFIVGLVYLGFRYRIQRIRKRNKMLEQRVKERTEEIETQKGEIESQRDQILGQKKEIEESIQVGKIIQDAILPPIEEIRKIFPDSFVFYKAKDIVSGDFFWFYRKDGRSYLAAADCTGHGVAGGFLTMIGQNHLHEITERDSNLTAAEILDQLNQRVIKSLRQRPDDIETRDGMDITLAIFEEGSNKVQYAGAKNPIYLIRNGTDEIEKLGVNAFSIGIPIRGDVKNFTNHTIELQKGDKIYMFSDGYADQFNEDYTEKFKPARFRETLMAFNGMPFQEQGKKLEEKIMNWKGDEEQTDDMLVMGLKF